MTFTAADLQMVDNHIAQGERHVARQEELLAFMRMRGYPTKMAEQLLAEFQSTLAQHRAHRELMRSEASDGPKTINAPAAAPSRGRRRPKRG